MVNKFRGDLDLLRPGLHRLRDLTGRPTYGVLPWSDRLWLDAEDSLSAVSDGVLGRPAPPVGAQWLRVAAIRLPRISNATDLEALACEPGVAVRYVTEPSRLADADLVVLPGSKATVADLDWLRRTGPGRRAARARRGRPAAARDLRRLPDAGPADRRRGRRGGGPRRVPRARPAGRRDRLRSRQAARPARPAPRSASRSPATRSTTARCCGAGSGRWSAPRPTARTRAPTPGTSSARTGTGCWRTTGSAAGCSAGRPPRPGAPASGPRRAPGSRCERERQLDLLGDLVEAHLDTAALRGADRPGRVAGPAGAASPRVTQSGR